MRNVHVFNKSKLIIVASKSFSIDMPMPMYGIARPAAAPMTAAAARLSNKNEKARTRISKCFHCRSPLAPNGIFPWLQHPVTAVCINIHPIQHMLVRPITNDMKSEQGSVIVLSCPHACRDWAQNKNSIRTQLVPRTRQKMRKPIDTLDCSHETSQESLLTKVGSQVHWFAWSSEAQSINEGSITSPACHCHKPPSVHVRVCPNILFPCRPLHATHCGTPSSTSLPKVISRVNSPGGVVASFPYSGIPNPIHVEVRPYLE